MMNCGENPELLSPVTLAYIGDAVFELFIRSKLISSHPGASIRKQHNAATARVNAQAQAQLLHAIFPTLLPAEQAIVQRGRNIRNLGRKSPDPEAYGYSTALEALLGFLYLKGDQSRLTQVLDQLWNLDNTPTGSNA